jgi:hypothetical protein
LFARWKRILAPTVIAALSIILFVHFDSEEPVPDENRSVAEAPNQSEKKSAADNVGPPTVGARQPTRNETKQPPGTSKEKSFKIRSKHTE